VEDVVDAGLVVGAGIHVGVGEGVKAGSSENLPVVAWENLFVS
jgi:hypothetical protein